MAHQGHRLRALNRLAAKLEARGDFIGALKAVEQAAKEAAGLFKSTGGLDVGQKD